MITRAAHPHRVDSGSGSVCQECHHLEPINIHLHEQTGEDKKKYNHFFKKMLFSARRGDISMMRMKNQCHIAKYCNLNLVDTGSTYLSLKLLFSFHFIPLQRTNTIIHKQHLQDLINLVLNRQSQLS